MAAEKKVYCMNCAEDHTYCVWCGEDLNKAHSPQCPLVIGAPTQNFWFYGQLMQVSKDDPETNLDLGRQKLMGSWHSDENGKLYIGIQNPEIYMRAFFETFSLGLLRVTTPWLFARSNLEKQNPIKRFFTKREIERLGKKREGLKETALKLVDSLGLPAARKKHWREKVERIYALQRFGFKPR